MEILTKEQGCDHIDKVFSKYTEYLVEDLVQYKKALKESVSQSQTTEKPAVFYYNLTLIAFMKRLESFQDDVNCNLLLGEAIEILN